MSNSRLSNLDKTENVGATIGFIFHANDEELEEVQSKDDNYGVKHCEENVKTKADILIPELLTKETIAEALRDQRNFLGKRSISVDSAYESPFANPIETWKKLNVLKEKITKTVEEKISEMKIDCNVLGKSSCSKLSLSKDSSSISDSEDTSESSKMSELWKNSEPHISSFESSNENLSKPFFSSDSCILGIKNAKKEIEIKEHQIENENELRSRKSFANFPDLIDLNDIKIATAKGDDPNGGSMLEDRITDDVESGVEAIENFNAEGSVELDGFTIDSGGRGSQNPPFRKFFNIISSEFFTHTKTALLMLFFALYYLFPLSDFLRGFLLSLLLTMFWETVRGYVQFDDKPQQQRSFMIPNYKAMPPLKVPESKPVRGIWFNEYVQENYDPDYYSVTHTVPAYVELKDNILKLSRPKGKIQRRATFDEPEYCFPWISERIFDISACNVFLMPEGLTRKRLFSKKYPIVIFLRQESLISEKRFGKDGEELPDGGDLEDQNISISPESPKSKGTLYLFARCDRQKEEWYRRLLSATRFCQQSEKLQQSAEVKDEEAEKTPTDDSPSKEPCTPFETVFFDDEAAAMEEYLRYMSKFSELILEEEDTPPPPLFDYRKHKHKKKDTNVAEDAMLNQNQNLKVPGSVSYNVKSTDDQNDINQLQWFNAFINRLLYDMFRSPYWCSKIHDKVQRKLNSIRLPYYVEEIEVIEFDLGKTGPMFHRVSQPNMDERGLWFDMDLTFEGLIRLTVQTHLNLLKLQKGIEETEHEGQHSAEKPKKGKRNTKNDKEPQAMSVRDSEGNEVMSSQYHKEEVLKPPARPSILNAIKEVPVTESVGDEPLNEPADEWQVESPEDFHNKLVDEIAQLAEIAVEEGLAGTETKVPKSDDTVNRCPVQARSAIYDSELEDSAESSDEEEEEEVQAANEAPTEDQPPQSTVRRFPKNRRSSKKIFKVFENVAKSKYFKSMAQSKYIQKAIAGFSAARLRLTIELKSCTGVLAVNIPPPPSDRFWYGFREMPKVTFSANPKIGEKALRFMHIKNYLQKKILYELKKLMVAPNMIDFVLPTSAPARSLSSLQIESDESEPKPEHDLQEETLSE